MSLRISALTALLFFFLTTSFITAKDKKKVLLPDYVLQAHTVLVVVNPEAGMSLENPIENRVAREDVEKAIMRWGRFNLAMEASTADLIILVQKGSGKIVHPVIGGIPLDNRPVIGESTDGQTRIGGQRGRQPDLTGANSGTSPGGPEPGAEMGPSGDRFEVYRGRENFPEPLDGTPVWRSISNDGLRSPGVPAVDEFRKVIEKAEEQAKKQPTKQTP